MHEKAGKRRKSKYGFLRDVGREGGSANEKKIKLFLLEEYVAVT